MLTSAQERYLKQALAAAMVIWKRMTDLQDTAVQITHDGYLMFPELQI
ncbi:MAG: hypothetical protein GAK36_00197 [Pseudomonas sp.]|nr:MAG: hypothetical protein GAK36_00197 [Pseudomonas sp.]